MNCSFEHTEHWHSVEDVMRILALSRQSVYNLMNDGELRSIKVGKSRRFMDHHLAAFFEEHEMEGV